MSGFQLCRRGFLLPWAVSVKNRGRALQGRMRVSCQLRAPLLQPMHGWECCKRLIRSSAQQVPLDRSQAADTVLAQLDRQLAKACASRVHCWQVSIPLPTKKGADHWGGRGDGHQLGLAGLSPSSVCQAPHS